MGKGDPKTRRGKIQIGSFGVVRPRKKTSDKKVAPKVKVVKEVSEKKASPVKKAASKKAPSKKES
jgi:ribosomal small subunit protein bTHX